MSKKANTYNFRYASERERFYNDQKAARRAYAKELTEEEQSAIRTVFDIGGKGVSKAIEKGKLHGEQGSGNYRGIRTFRDLRLLQSFLFDTSAQKSGALWKKPRMSKYKITARVSLLKRRGKRVTGEETFQSFNIIWEGDDDETDEEEEE